MSTHPQAPAVRHRRRRKAVIRAAGELAELADLYMVFSRVAGLPQQALGRVGASIPFAGRHPGTPWTSPPTPRQPARASPSSVAGPFNGNWARIDEPVRVGHPDTAGVGPGFAYGEIDMTRGLRDSLIATKGSGTHRPGSRPVARPVCRTGPDTPIREYRRLRSNWASGRCQSPSTSTPLTTRSTCQVALEPYRLVLTPA